MNDQNARRRFPPLSAQYYKARRQYVLFSALLVGWELIGIRLPEDGRIATQFEIVLTNPEVFPIVLLALVFYFAFRFSVEWNQCPPPRRAMTVSRLDFVVAHALGGLAIVVFSIQKALAVNVGGFVASYGETVLYAGLSLSLSFFAGYCVPLFKGGHGDSNFALSLHALTVLTAAIASRALIASDLHPYLRLGLVVSLLFLLWPPYLAGRRRGRVRWADLVAGSGPNRDG